MMKPTCTAKLALAFVFALTAYWTFGWAPTVTAESHWRQWGGPSGDFSAADPGLATAWPAAGPEVVWERELGEGYSAIVADRGRLFTMFHRGGDEVVIAIDAATGRTVWETAYAAPQVPGMNLGYGPGPHATPAIAGQRLFTVGATGRLNAFDFDNGEILWSHDLMAEYGAPLMPRGFGASPLVHGDLVIVTPGGEDHAVIAFRQAGGELTWKSQSFRPGYSSPILARVGGEDQVIVAMGPERAGLDPLTGKLDWHLRLRPEAATMMGNQLWCAQEEILFGSAAYSDGSRAIAVDRQQDDFKAEELWYSPDLRIQHGTAVRFGEWIYGSSGDFGPATLAAIHVETGELGFRQRGFAKANLVRVGEKMLILDEEGDLALASPRPDGLEIHSRAHVIEPTAWTVPTLVGTRLFLRNRKRMKALELGAS